MADLPGARKAWKSLSQDPSIAQLLSGRSEVLVVVSKTNAQGAVENDVVLLKLRQVSVIQVLFGDEVVDTIKP